MNVLFKDHFSESHGIFEMKIYRLVKKCEVLTEL